MWSIWHGCSAEGKTRQPYTSTGAAKPLMLTDQIRLISTPIPSMLSFCAENCSRFITFTMNCIGICIGILPSFQATQEHFVMILHLAQANEDFSAKEYTKKIMPSEKQWKGRSQSRKKDLHHDSAQPLIYRGCSGLRPRLQRERKIQCRLLDLIDTVIVSNLVWLAASFQFIKQFDKQRCDFDWFCTYFVGHQSIFGCLLVTSSKAQNSGPNAPLPWLDLSHDFDPESSANRGP